MSATAKNNFQEYDPRHRLTGAVVLILLAIILLPMLLSKEQEVQTPETDPVVMEITKEGKKVFVSRITSPSATNLTTAADGQKAAGKPESEQGEVADSSLAEKPENSKEDVKESSALFKPMSSMTTKTTPAEVKPADKNTTKTAAIKPPAKAPSSTQSTSTKAAAAVASGGWILQVGVFSQSANANNKAADLKKKGFDAKTSAVKTSKGVVTKVWLGPFKDRKSAETMQDRLQHKTRQRGIVVKN